MRRNKLAVYVHLVWSTWDRAPLITPEIERRVHRNIESEAQKLGCTVVAINGTTDHVHIIVKLPTTLTIAKLTKQVKGVSSHFVNETLRPDFTFKWQGGYGAFSISLWDLERAINYVRKQKKHHNSGEIITELETTFEEFESKNEPDD